MMCLSQQIYSTDYGKRLAEANTFEPLVSNGIPVTPFSFTDRAWQTEEHGSVRYSQLPQDKTIQFLDGDKRATREWKQEQQFDSD